MVPPLWIYVLPNFVTGPYVASYNEFMSNERGRCFILGARRHNEPANMPRSNLTKELCMLTKVQICNGIRLHASNTTALICSLFCFVMV